MQVYLQTECGTSISFNILHLVSCLVELNFGIYAPNRLRFMGIEKELCYVELLKNALL